MDRLTQGKGCNRSHSAGIPRKSANVQARSRAVRVGKVVHPCRVKSLRKVVSTVMDKLVTDSETIENLNLHKILKTQEFKVGFSRVIRGSCLSDDDDDDDVGRLWWKQLIKKELATILVILS